VTVLDGQLPVISSQPASKTVCATSNATFNVTANTVPNANGPISYQWQQFNGTAWVNIAGATAASFAINNVTVAMNTNTFRVVLTGLCSVVNSGAATLFVNPLPSVIISSSGPVDLLPAQSTNLVATTFPPGGTHSWQFNGTALNTTTGPVLGPLTVDDIGSYSVIYTDPNGCVRASNTIVISGQPTEKLWVYPNPNHGRFQVRFFNQANESAIIMVYNAIGRLVLKKAVVTGLAYSSTEVDLGINDPGVYIVKVIGAGGRELAAKSIIVQ
jgi:hypothetical protein